MACPACGCKCTYQFDDHEEDVCSAESSGYMQRCAACGAVFDLEDGADEEDEAA